MIYDSSHSIKDRLAHYIHWQSRANFDQAVLICCRQTGRVDLAAVERWCRAEGGQEVYNEVVEQLTAHG